MRFFLSALVLLFSNTLLSATWVTNKDHSEILFKVPYMKVGEVTGRFNEFTGSVDFNDNGDLAGKLSVIIHADSIDTGNRMRDGHLKGEDFFQSKNHPKLSFTSDKITKITSQKYKALGTLSIRGVSRPAEIEFTVSQMMKDTWGHQNRFVSFKSSLKRSDFEMNWNKTLDGKEFLLGDLIAFGGSFQLQPSNDKTPNSKHMIPDTEYIRERDRDRWEGKTKNPEEESAFSRTLRKLINGK